MSTFPTEERQYRALRELKKLGYNQKQIESWTFTDKTITFKIGDPYTVIESFIQADYYDKHTEYRNIREITVNA